MSHRWWRPRTLTARVTQLEQETRRMSLDQQHLDQQVAALRDAANQQNNAIIAIQSEIDQLKTQNPGVDFSGLDQQVTAMQSTTSQLEALATEGAGTAPAAIPAEAHQQLGQDEQLPAQPDPDAATPVPNQPAEDIGATTPDGTPTNVVNPVPTSHGVQAPAANKAPQEPQGPAGP